MKKTIGIIMLVMFFVCLFGEIWITSSFLEALSAFSFAIGVTVFIVVAVYLIVD